jgi:hypothetical protein
MRAFRLSAGHSRAYRRLLLLATGALLSHGRVLSAQVSCSGAPTCTVTVQLGLTRNHVASLLISSAATALPTISANDFAAGFTAVSGPTVTVRSNAPYVLTLQSAQPTWSYAGTASNPVKPASDLEWSNSATGVFTSSAASGRLWPSAAGSAPPTSAQTVPLFYRVRWSWVNSPPGAYSLPVTITLTSP